MTGSTRRHPSWGRQALLVARKDLTIELRTGEVLATSGLFATLVVVLASMAFYAGPETSAEVAPGVLWIALSFAAVLALGRSWHREREQDALSGMLAMPVARSAIFAGKALGVALFVVLLELLVVPLTALLLDAPIRRVGLPLVLLCLLASPGIAAAGTLFGAMTARTGARELVLAVVLFPLLAPTILASVVATRELFTGAALADIMPQLSLLGVFDTVFCVGGLALFGSLVEG